MTPDAVLSLHSPRTYRIAYGSALPQVCNLLKRRRDLTLPLRERLFAHAGSANSLDVCCRWLPVQIVLQCVLGADVCTEIWQYRPSFLQPEVRIGFGWTCLLISAVLFCCCLFSPP